ncbi:hypothetical protein QYM36_011997 [Artemia franciscana]|uniref:Uncharacterized protein n=1 Tax=Artemia franciscana TaxID=6661 RepID=A0AA88KX23_ARTSF|nr:hypothetical protein QYM36_011997 [Artemia franciscana]
MDKGAEANVLPLKEYERLYPYPILNKTNSILTSYSNGKLNVDGVCEAEVQYKDRAGQKHKFFMIDALEFPIFSRQTSVDVKNVGFRQDKCTFGTYSIQYFGYRMNPEGTKPDPEKTRTISEILPPENNDQLQKLLVLLQMNCYSDNRPQAVRKHPGQADMKSATMTSTYGAINKLYTLKSEYRPEFETSSTDTLPRLHTRDVDIEIFVSDAPDISMKVASVFLDIVKDFDCLVLVTVLVLKERAQYVQLGNKLNLEYFKDMFLVYC